MNEMNNTYGNRKLVLNGLNNDSQEDIERKKRNLIARIYFMMISNI